MRADSEADKGRVRKQVYTHAIEIELHSETIIAIKLMVFVYSSNCI